MRGPHTAVVIVPRVAGCGSAASRLAPAGRGRATPAAAGLVPRLEGEQVQLAVKDEERLLGRPGRCAPTSNRGATSASNTDQAPDWPAPTAVPAAAALRGGVEPDLLEEVAWCQTDDFWRYALFAAVTYIRIAAGWRACRCVRYARS